MEGKLERWYPLVLGIVVSGAYYFFLRSLLPLIQIKDLLSATISLSAIIVGFLATAMSVLFSIEKKYVIQQLKNTRVYRKLINYFMSAINWSFLLAAISSVGLLIDFTNQRGWHSAFFALWLFALIVAGACYYRIISIFAAILRTSD